LRFLLEPLQLHLHPADLLEQLSFLCLYLLFVLALADLCGLLACAIQQLPLPLVHLDGMYGVISSDLLGGLATTDRLHGDPRLELGTVGAVLPH